MSLVNGIFGYTKVATINYTDVNLFEWYAYTISVAKEAGYINGYTDGTMRPDSPITREEVATIIMKLNALAEYPESADVLLDSGLLDWSKGAVGSVLHAGIMNGYIDGSFASQSYIKRGEGLVALTKSHKYYTSNGNINDDTNILVTIAAIKVTPNIPINKQINETPTAEADAKAVLDKAAADAKAAIDKAADEARIEAARTITVGNSIDLIAAAKNVDISNIIVSNDITLGATLDISNNYKVIDLKGFHLIVAGNPILVHSDNSKLINGFITGAVIIGGEGKGFIVENIDIVGALTTSNTSRLVDNITFINGSVSLAITSTNPAKLFEGTDLTAAIAPSTGTKLKDLTITGAVSANFASFYENVTFTGAVTSNVASSIFKNCIFNGAVTNLSGESDYSGSTFYAATTNTAGNAIYRSCIFNGPLTNTSGDADYSNSIINGILTISGGNAIYPSI